MSFFQILHIRIIHEHYSKLLSREERQYVNREQAFQPFTGLNPLQYNPFTLPLWNAAVAQYSKNNEPVENQIAVKLREHFANTKAKSFQVLFFVCDAMIDRFGEFEGMMWGQIHNTRHYVCENISELFLNLNKLTSSPKNI